MGAVFYSISSSEPTKSNGSFTKFPDFKLQIGIILLQEFTIIRI
ncbi:hypothetical protein HMPREF0204_14889 [Chryseobacterium gleum ATCC 35910]|uniref:Uncharacterized protein n=1 Tax=Chryseobacterium gleum ATCC 35910 TaxID=525257 RepID=A0ABN0ARY7_CHRGE|nr:hypothetical protein HMPREF0204_14889 [Chryseobacterium gleum ATCC 35910]